jgi:hypothetical protein
MVGRSTAKAAWSAGTCSAVDEIMECITVPTNKCFGVVYGIVMATSK